MSIAFEGPDDAEIMVLGEHPGAEEIAKGRPFLGHAGQLMDRMLADAGIARNTCRIGYVCGDRPPHNDIDNWMPGTKSAQTSLLAEGLGVEILGRVVHKSVAIGHSALIGEINRVRPKIIIALGNTALWATAGLASVAKWRGSTLACNIGGLDVVVIPTISPASVLRQWSVKPIVVQDLRRAADVLRRGVPDPQWSFTIRPTLRQVLDRLSSLHQEADAALASGTRYKLSIDIETRAGHIACLGIAWNKREALCIPFLCVERPDGYWTADEEAEIVASASALIRHPAVLSVGQNFIYDTQYFVRHWGTVPVAVRDTMVAFHVCFPGMPKSLDHIASMTNDFYVYWKDDGKEWDKGADQDEDKYWTYNCEDCVRTYEADDVLQLTVDRMGLRGPHDFQQSLFGPVLRTMVRGVRVDRDRMADMRKRLRDHAAWCLREISLMAGQELNPKSPKQMKEFFYDVLGLPKVINRKTKSPSCDDAALDTLASKHLYIRPMVALIKEFRSCETVAANALKSSAVGWDGRLHCSYNITGTTTFRFSSSTDAFGSGMNLQNITAGDE
jgi:uracil-DNA glycosylase